jgi:hypothetical protein
MFFLTIYKNLTKDFLRILLIATRRQIAKINTSFSAKNRSYETSEKKKKT